METGFDRRHSRKYSAMSVLVLNEYTLGQRGAANKSGRVSARPHGASLPAPTSCGGSPFAGRSSAWVAAGLLPHALPD
jgi:hypothetical protein